MDFAFLAVVAVVTIVAVARFATKLRVAAPLILVLVGFALVTISGCFRVNKFQHEPVMAAAEAHDFAHIAFVKRDASAAYGLLSPNIKAQMSFDQFKDLVSKMHPSDYPEAVEATDYEPLPGQKAMHIYLTGSSGSERFYYRFLMEGTKETRYAVAGLRRGAGPFPPSNMRRPLQ